MPARRSWVVGTPQAAMLSSGEVLFEAEVRSLAVICRGTPVRRQVGTMVPCMGGRWCSWSRETRGNIVRVRVSNQRYGAI